jgi:hypothetical protein
MIGSGARPRVASSNVRDQVVTLVVLVFTPWPLPSASMLPRNSTDLIRDKIRKNL